MLNGYRVVYLPDHPAAMQSSNWLGYVYEHTVIAEAALGRRMSDTEVVHHLNGDRAYNRAENLLVLERGMHGRLHAWLAKGAPGAEMLRQNWVNSANSKLTPTDDEPAEYCEVCNLTLQFRQKKFCCDAHAKLSNRKVERPPVAQLLEELKVTSFRALGRKYGVSDNAIRKWLELYGVNMTTLSLASSTLGDSAETSGEVKPS